MAEDMSSLLNNLKGMLENGTIPENVKSAMENLSNSSSNSGSNASSSGAPNIDPQMLGNLMNMLKGSSSNTEERTEDSSNFNIDMDTLLKMKTIMEKMNSKEKDPRSNLLLSLKPYLKESRKSKVDQYVQLLNMTKVIDVLNPTSGGDKK